MIGVIADDLSGAAEIGAVGLRHGLTAEVVCGESFSGEADLACVDTDSRSCEPEEAARRVAAAARGLADAGARWIYKKVDSVLRGRIVAELSALMAEQGRGLTLLVPANPSFGRVIRGGHYLVHGKPIHETEFARDPEYPRHSPDVRELLGSAGGNVVHVCRPLDPFPQAGIVIGEAAAPEDIVAWTARRTDQMVVAGAAEFFGALMAMERGPARSKNSVDVPAGVGELFICGSASQAARQFVEEQRAAGTRVFPLPAALSTDAFNAVALEVVAAIESGGRAILMIGPRPAGESGLAKRLAAALVQIAVLVLALTPVGRVFAEGGATAAELVRTMGWSRLRLLREVAPGVAALAAGPAQSVLLTIKPGSYEWPAEVRYVK